MASKFRTIGRGSLDSKNRLSLSRVVKELTRILNPEDMASLTFRIKINAAGDVLLVPEVAIPVQEIHGQHRPAEEPAHFVAYA